MIMTQERRTGILFAGIAASVLILLLVVFLASRSSGLRYTVVFEKGKDIRVGDRVQMNGVDVGQVDQVKFADRAGQRVNVRLKIAEDHRNRVQFDSTAYIRDATFPNVSGQKVIEVANSTKASGPMREGAVIEGKNSLLEFKAWQLRGKIEEWGKEVQDATRELGGGAVKELGEGAKGAARGLKEGAKELAPPGEFKEILEKLTRFLATIPEKARTGMDKAIEEWERLKTEVGPAIQKLKESGRQMLSEKLERLVKEIEEQFAKLRDAWEKDRTKQEKPASVEI